MVGGSDEHGMGGPRLKLFKQDVHNSFQLPNFRYVVAALGNSVKLIEQHNAWAVSSVVQSAAEIQTRLACLRSWKIEEAKILHQKRQSQTR